MQEFDKARLKKIINLQKNETTEYHVYKKIAKHTKDKKPGSYVKNSGRN